MVTRKVRVAESVAAIANGEVDVTEWDREELIRGQRRARDGTFRGRPSKLVPRTLYDELRRRTVEVVNEEIRAAALPAVEALRQIVDGEVRPDPTRLRAIQEVLDRVLGKAPAQVDIRVGIRPYEEVLSGGIVRDIPAALDDPNITDAEVVEEDEEDDWPFNDDEEE